ncbi:MAG TPA: hypothetical protein VGF72_04405 [Gaiellaceae bacterium]
MPRIRSFSKTGPLFEEKLGEHPETGDLSDCRKIYFDKARYRIVYRVLPNEKRPKSVEVTVIGARAELEVYTRSAGSDA